MGQNTLEKMPRLAGVWKESHLRDTRSRWSARKREDEGELEGCPYRFKRLCE